MDFAALYRAEKEKAKAAMAKANPQVQESKPAVQFTLVDLGHGIRYAEEFLTAAEAETLTNAIDSVSASNWAVLTRRRLLNLGGIPHPCGSWAEPLPGKITDLVCQRLQSSGLFGTMSPNQILLNEYLDGEGIDPHKDGPLFEPIACIVSLGGDAVLNFYATEDTGEVVGGGDGHKAPSSPFLSVVLRPNSLVVFSGEAYESLTHAIDTIDADVVATHCLNLAQTGTAIGDVLKRSHRRLSLTLRRLARVDREFVEHDYIPPEVESERVRRRAWWLSSISEKALV